LLVFCFVGIILRKNQQPDCPTWVTDIIKYIFMKTEIICGSDLMMTTPADDDDGDGDGDGGSDDDDDDGDDDGGGDDDMMTMAMFLLLLMMMLG
jgi:hypothetical protein